MINQELLDEIIYVSLKNEFISKELIEKIVIDIVNNYDEITKKHFKSLSFEKEDWDFAIASCYSDGRITADYDEIINWFSKYDISYLQKNLDLIQCLMHEIGHLKHKSQRLSKGFEAELIKRSGADYVENVYLDRALIKTNNFNFSRRFANKKFRKFYENNYFVIPTERLAEIGSRKELLQSLDSYPGFSDNFFIEYRQSNNAYIRALKSGYRRLENGRYSIPLIEYFINLKSTIELQKLGFDIYGKKIPEEVKNYDSEVKMLYGLPIKPKDVIEINRMKILTRR